jgi:hypothetical protein
VIPTTLTPGLSFGSVVENTSKVEQATFWNFQTVPINFSSIAVPAPYAITTGSNSCSTTTPLAARSSCSIYLAFTPTSLGSTPAMVLTVNDDAAAGSQTMVTNLSGSGVIPTTLSSVLGFGSVFEGTTSNIEKATFSNYQAIPLTFSSIAAPAPYALASGVNSCSTSTALAANSVCYIYLTFSPITSGAAPPSVLAITDNAGAGPQNLTTTLSGSGLVPTAITSALGFGSIVESTSSAVEKATVSNYLPASLTLSSITAPSPYTVTTGMNACSTATALPANSVCYVYVVFTPTAAGAVPASTLTVTDNASAGPQTLTTTLTGTGTVDVALVPSSIAFGSVATGTTSTTHWITVSNNTSGTLSVTQAIFNGQFALDTTSAAPSPGPAACPIAGGTVSGSLASHTSCVFGVKYAPTTLGATSGGKVTLLDSAVSSPQMTTLSGTGVTATALNPATLPFGSVVVNTTSPAKMLTFANYQTVPVTLNSITAAAPYAVTSGANACATAAPITANASCKIYITLSPTALGAAPATTLTITDNAASGPQTLSSALTGAGTSAVTTSPTALGYGNVVLGQRATRNLIVVNNQSSPLSIASVTGFPAAYSLDTANTTCPIGSGTLPAAPTGNTCVIAVDLTATTLGAQAGSLTIADNATPSSIPIPLGANAVQPVALSHSSLSFPATFVGLSSAGQSVTLTNEQNIPLSIASVTVAGSDPNDFAPTTTCPIAPAATLPALMNCTVSIKFTPIASGTRTATLQITDLPGGGSQTVALTGPGNAPVLVSPMSITNFAAAVGAISPYQTIKITNAQTATALHISSVQFNGDFQQTATTCGSTPPYVLAPGASCNVTVSFAPTIGGTRTGQLQLIDDAASSPQIANLSGSATSPLTILPASLSFSAQTLNTSSAPKTIVLTNHETQSETFTLAATGDYAASSNCATGTIAAQSSCNVFVTFTPSSTSPSTRAGTLTVTHSAAVGSPIAAPLTGSAIATNPAAAVAVVSPGAGAAGTMVNVVITGNGWTHFNSSSMLAFVDTNNSSYASDITVVNSTAVTANQINATLQLAGGSGVIYGARNLAVTTPLSGGETERASLLSAFIIEDPTQSFEITAVSPAFGTQGQTLNVSLTAVGTRFVQGTTFANFGDGITVDNLTITTATTANATITISNTTPVGYRTITLVTGGQFATSILSPQNNPIFQIGPNNATLVSVSPNTEPQGFSGSVTLTAAGTHFLESATQVSIAGAIVGSVNVTSPTTAIAQVAVPASAPVGPQNVTVATGGEIAGLSNAFTITGATPALLSITPSTAQQGATLSLVITGNAYTNFLACGTLGANFTGEITTNTVVANSASQVTANISISQNANVGSITANLICGSTLFPFTFTVTPSSAQIISVVPSSVPQGGQVTLTVTGLNTHWTQSDTMASFYPQEVPTPSVDLINIIDATHATLNVAVPTNSPVGSYGFYMATGGEMVSASVGVYANTPTLTMSPANGLVPSGSTPNTFSVSFTGQFTHFSQTGTVPVIVGEGVTLTNFTVNNFVGAVGTINIAPGAATGLRLVTFTTGGEIVTTYLNVTVIPVGIILVSPDHAAQSTTLNVEIVGLNTHFSQASTQVLFGPQITVNSVTVNSPTDLVANITTSYLNTGVLTPSSPGFDTVYVNTGAEMVIGGFGVDPPATPTIVGVSPSSAAQGSGGNDVTITGSLTHWVQGQSELILGAGVTVSNLQIVSPTSAAATIGVSPTAPVGGNSVIMITGSEIDSGTGFSVTPSAAEILSVGPAVSCQGGFTVAGIPGCGGPSSGPWVVAQLQTTTLNIVGVGTHWLQGETTMSFGPGVNIDLLTVSSPTTAQVQITVLSSSPIGFVPLTTYTDGETVTLQQAIDIEQGSPALLAIAPSAGQQGVTLTLQVLGRFTHWQQGVTSAAFNQDITVNSINVIDSQNMTANITVSPLAYVDFSTPCGHVITVTTGSEQVTGIPGEFCVQQGAEQIANVSPLSGIQGSTETITITGSVTNFEQGVTQVSFGDPNFQVGQITVNSPTSLSAPVAITTSASTGFKRVTVTTLGQVATQQYSFTVSPGVATLNEAIPNQAEQGAPLSGQPPLVVRLLGQYSHFSSSSTATFGAGITVQSVSFVSTTEIDATIAIDPLSYAGDRLVTVTTPNVPCSDQPPANVAGVVYQGCTPGSSAGYGNEIVTNNAFTIIPGPAIIANLSPATGNEGQEVAFTITGSATHWAQNFTQFYIAGGGSDITVNNVVINSPTQATADISISPTANPGARSIYMVTNGESLTDSGAFVVTGGIPVVTSIGPNNALQGTTGLQVTITGNAYTAWTTATTVNFGPGVSITNLQWEDASHIEAVINVASGAQVGYRTVVVQTGPQGLTGYFQVTAPAPPPTPYIWYENPSSGIPGQTVTITFLGAYTHWDPNPTTGTQLTGFLSGPNGVVVNSFQVTGPTTALANVTISPTATAATYDLTLTTATAAPQEVDNAQFSVVVAQPTLSVVDPGSAIQGAQNVMVNIIGQFTHFDSTTTFSFGNGITANGPPTILGPTIATQTISVGIETPTGGYQVVSTTPDAPAGQMVVGGAYFDVTPSLALISAITPNTGLQGTTVTVEMTGQNTHWDGSTSFNFGAGIVVTTTQVNSATDATLTLAIPALASEGPTGASATTGGEVARITNGFVVQAGTPLLLFSGPGSLAQQSSAVFTILSQSTSWTQANPPVVSYGAGVVVTNVQVTSPTSMTVDGYVQPTTTVGYRNLTVTTGSQILELNNAFYVSPGPAVINSVSPNTEAQGANLPAVQITGTNTNWQQGVTTLSFPGVLVNSLTVNSATSITANITVSQYATAGQVTLTATTLGEVATGVNEFTVLQSQPELLSVVSGSGAQGATESVTITGDFTHFSSSSTVSFGTGITANSITVNSGTSLGVNITVQPTTTTGLRSVTVTTGSEIVSLSNSFNVTLGPAAIASLNPGTGGQGNSYNVAVVGSQTHFTSGATNAFFGGGITVTGITVTDLLHATVNIQIPNGTALDSYNVSLTTGGEVATILGGFTVTSGSPFLSAVNPPTGTQGSANLSVQLTGQFTSFVNGTSVANFATGITVNSTMVTGATSATANITISPTATLGARTVTVTTGSQVAFITGGFTVLAGVPALVNTSPGTAQAGASGVNVIIDGQFTTFQQGFSTVSFGAGISVTNVTVNTTTQLIATINVASNASVGSRNVSVSTNSQVLTLNNGFGVTAGTPAITQINPNIGNPGQSNLAVSITGQYTNWVSGTTVANFGAGITVVTTVVSNPTSLVATISIPSGTAVGPYTVMTTTGSEVENVPGGFTVQAASIPGPSVISLSPGAYAGGMPTNSLITVVFSQPMMRSTINTGSVLLYLTSNPNQGYISVPGTVNLDASGRVLTFTPSSLLAVNSTYQFQLTTAIQDATGNGLGNFSVTLYTTDTANLAAPTVVAVNPPVSATGIGTNVIPQIEFSADMDQATQTGMTLSTGGSAIAGAYSWNANVNCCTRGPGTILAFTPAAPLSPNTTYTVTYTNALTDTAGNAIAPGSFTFTTGAGADTTNNSSGSDFTSGIANVGVNFVPRVDYTKPMNPIDVDASTLLLYNSDSGKYIQGVVAVAPNGLSATFTPSAPLLPDTQYRINQSGGDFDADANYQYGGNWYFTTGAGADTTPPTVSSIAPANNATAVPLNAQVVAHFSAPVEPASTPNAITVTPSGGSAIPGVVTLASDMMTLTFVPSSSLLPGAVYNVQVSGYSDPEGNSGATFTSSFTTASSLAPINVSTGISASGSVILTSRTPDPHWNVVPTASTALGLFAATTSTNPPATGPAQPLLIVAPGDTGFYSGWAANGPNSSWININPQSVSGNTFGVYSTTFNIAGPTVPSNLCLTGGMGVDDNGILGVNGTAIMGNLSDSFNPSAPAAQLNIPISTYLVVGSNTLSLGWGSTDNVTEAFRLQAVIETCGASFTGGLTLTTEVPANSATGVSTSTNIVLTFNHPLDPATVNATTLPVMIGYNSNQEIQGNYIVSGNLVTFTPDSPFPASTQIYVGTCNGPLDLAGDSAGGCYTALTSFTTGATVTPASAPFKVAAFAPAANATNVGLRAPVTATFNRSVNLGSVNSNDFALFAGDSQSPWCTSSAHSQDDATLLFNCYPLPATTVMTADLTSGLTDWQGNALTNFSGQFTTSQYDSNTNGTAITVRPAIGSAGISPGEPITLFFNLPINASTATNGIEVAENNAAVPGSVQVQDGGYSLVFTPSVPWTAGALIQWWTTGSLLDTTYNTPVTSASGYFYPAASTSTLAPAIQVMSPVNGSTAAPNSMVDVQFNVPLSASTVNSTNIFLYDSGTGLHVAGTYSMPQPNVVRIVPAAPFTPSATIYLYIETGLQSTTSVPVASQTYQYFSTTASNDTTTPTVVSAVPYSGATGVGINVTPEVVFSKTIDTVSVTSSSFEVESGGTPLLGNFWFSSNDTRIGFTPNDALPADTVLTINVNGLLDLEGHPVSFNSTFQTGAGPDFQSPTVVSTSVSANGSIPTNGMIAVQFSESMDITTFNSGNFLLQDQLLGTRVPAALTWSANQSTAYLAPTSPLAAGRQYYFSVTSGTDLAGNQLSGYAEYIYAELGSASTGPSVIAFNPLSGGVGLGTNAIIKAEFSAPIDPNTTGSVTLTTGGNPVPTTASFSAGSTVIELVPATPLAPNTTYVMTIAGVKDPAGDPVTTVTNSFKTGPTYDITPATATSSDPADNTTVGTNVIPKFVFDKPLNPITVNTGTFRMFLSDSGQQIPLTVTPSASGLEVTMTPLIPLLPNTEYHFQGCCGFQDQDGNNGNQIDEYFLTGSGSSTAGPTVTVSPVNGATAIPLNAEVIVMSTVPLDVTTIGQNAIEVFDPSNSPVAGTITVQPGAQQINFVPTSALVASTIYTVKVNNFTDANGNAVVPSTTTFTTGSAASNAGLTFTGSNIVDGATGVSPTQPIILTFSQILDPTTVSSATLKVMSGWNSNYPLAGTYAVSGDQVTFTPTSPYPPGGQVYVGECGGPTDVLGDVFQNGNCYGQQLVYFTVVANAPDTTPLTVVSVNPASGATNVRPDVSVSVTFNKSINPYTIFNNGNNALLFSGQSLQDRGSITMSADDRTITFNVGALNQGTTYTIELPAGGVADPSGNTLATTYTSSFIVGSNPATGNGSVTTTSPGANATGVPTNALLTLDVNRQVNPSSLAGNLNVTVNGNVYPGTVQALASDYEVQFTPTTPFPAGATVQWWFSNVYDSNGDVFNGDSGTFYVAPEMNPATAQPTVIAVSPGYGSSTMPINGEIDIAYNLPIDPTTVGGGNVYFNTGTVATASVLPSPNNNIVRLVPNASLTAGSNYYVCANSNVKGTNGVATQGNCWNTNFTVPGTAAAPDTTVGTLKVGPPNGVVNVGTNAYIRLNFSKPVDRTAINSNNVHISAGGNPIPGSWSFNLSNNDVVGANFSPLNPLPPSTLIIVASSNLLDYAGNVFTSPTAQFTTAALPDYTTPTAQQDFPYNTGGIATNASFTCRYSEPMDPSSVTPGNTNVYSDVTNAIVPVTYTWSSDLMSVTMKPVSPLYADSQYSYQCYGAIDLTGNGQSNSYVNFYTGAGPSTAGPILLDANPPEGITNVPLNSTQGPWDSTSYGLEFNVPVAADSLSKITLTPQGGSPIPIATDLQYGGAIVPIMLPYALSPNTTYTYGVSGVTDLNGNVMSPTTSTFTTGSAFDWNNPTLVSTVPANNAVNVPVTIAISFTFSEAMSPLLFDNNHAYLRNHNTLATISTTYTISSDYKTISLTPTVPLAAATIYDLYTASPTWYIFDIAGNVYYNQSVVATFTTGTPAAVNGACGSANGQSYSSAPTQANLCSTGTASQVLNSSGSFTWTCNGQYAGTNAACSATVAAGPSCYTPTAAPVSWWSGNNTPNDTEPLPSGGGNNGVLENGATYNLGEVGDAFDLTGNAGSSPADQYILIGDPVPTDLQIQNAITLQAWIYVTAPPNGSLPNGGGALGLIVGSQHDGTTSGATIFYDGNTNSQNITGIPPGHIQFQIGNGSWHEYDTTTQVPMNQWVLITATRTANNPARIYYNGVLQQSVTSESAWNGTITYGGSWLAIGQQSDYNRPFNGLADEVQIYNVALSQADIAGIYNAGSTGVCQ